MTYTINTKCNIQLVQSWKCFELHILLEKYICIDEISHLLHDFRQLKKLSYIFVLPASEKYKKCIQRVLIRT